MTTDERLNQTLRSIVEGAALAQDLLANPAKNVNEAEEVLDAMVIMSEGWSLISDSLVSLATERLTEARNAGL